MIKAAVLGSPINHSLSPTLHNAAYEILGVAGEYGRVELTELTAPAFFHSAIAERWTGFSLTMPLKEIAFSSGDLILPDEIAQRIYSANTLLARDDHFLATSTDYLAFRRLLADSDVERVVILGGGGTARAALGAITDRVDQCIIALRGASDSPRAAALRAISPKIQFVEFGSSIAGASLVINTTPVGAADIYADEIESALFESLYHPWPSKIAESAIERGLRLLSGKSLLVEQALDQIALMTGKKFDFDEMREQLLPLI